MVGVAIVPPLLTLLRDDDDDTAFCDISETNKLFLNRNNDISLQYDYDSLSEYVHNVMQACRCYKGCCKGNMYIDRCVHFVI